MDKDVNASIAALTNIRNVSDQIIRVPAKLDLLCHTLRNTGLIHDADEALRFLCSSKKNHSVVYQPIYTETDSLVNHRSWIDIVVILVLVSAICCNALLLQKEKLVKRRNQGSRLLYLSGITMDIVYCLQAFVYSVLYFIRSLLHADPQPMEECFVMTANAFSLKMVFSLNLIMVITRFIAIFFPFWFIVKVNKYSAKICLMVAFSIAFSESSVIVGYCVYDSLEMVSNYYWAVSTLSSILFIVLCNAVLHIMATVMFRRQRKKIYKRNGTYTFYKNLTATKAAIQQMGAMAIGAVGMQAATNFQMNTSQKQHVKLHCFKEHEDKKKLKKLLLLTSVSYLLLVLPHFLIQILGFGREDPGWIWVRRLTLLLLDARFLVNPVLYKINKVRAKRILNRKTSIANEQSANSVV